MESLVFGLLWLAVALIGGSVNSQKGRSFVEGFALTLFLGVIGLILVIFLPRAITEIDETRSTQEEGNGRDGKI